MLEGADFLRAVLDFTAKCEEQSDQCLTRDMNEQLGTLLSLLDRASSCWWGCRGDVHTAEHLIGRCCSYAMGAFALARSGFYDESIVLTRTLGEIANLCYLFAADSNALREWTDADDKRRRDKFSPVKVRLALEQTQRPVPIDQNRYRQLSEKATHVTPSIPPQMYNASGVSKAGGVFQEAGLFFCFAEIGHALSIVAHCAVPLCTLGRDPAERVNRAANALGAALPDARSRVNESFPGTYT